MDRISFLLRVFWALPNTLLGLLIGSVGMCFGGQARIRGCVIEFYDGGTKWFIQRLPHGFNQRGQESYKRVLTPYLPPNSVFFILNVE